MEEFRSVMTTLGEKLSRRGRNDDNDGDRKERESQIQRYVLVQQTETEKSYKLLLLKGVSKSSSYQKSCVQYLEPGYMQNCNVG